MHRKVFLFLLSTLIPSLSVAKSKPIVLFFAMDSEATTFLSRHKIKSCNHLLDKRLTLNCYKLKNIKKRNVYVVTNKINANNIARVATQPAAVATWEIINKLSPELIINAGTAGGYKSKQAKIGTVFLCDKYAVYHDRRIPLDNNWISYGKGYYPCIPLDNISKQIGVLKGNISTGNSLDLGPTDEKVISQMNISIKDMEAAAIADIANITGTKFTAIKSVTDIVDKDADTATQFNENFSIATKNLANKLTLLIEKLL